MKNNHFYVVHSFMIQDLKLKPNEALIYAIIYGFSKDRQSSFSGSLRYLTKNTNLSKQTVINILQSLVRKKYIIKSEIFNEGIKFCKYTANLDILVDSQNFRPPVKNLEGDSQKIELEVVQNLDESSQKIGHNNIDNKIDNNIIDSIEDFATESQPTPDPKTEPKEIRHKYGEYSHVMLTDKQYNSLVEKYGTNIIDDYIKKMDEWIQLKGKSPYKDFNLAIQNWLKKDNIQPIQVYNYDNNQDLGGWW